MQPGDITLPAGEDPRSKGVTRHPRENTQLGCFSSQQRPRTRKIWPGWWQRLSRLSTGRRYKTKVGDARTPSKHKSHTSLFGEQATISLMLKGTARKLGHLRACVVPSDLKDLGPKVAPQESHPLSALPKAGGSCWVCPGSCSVAWTTSL